MGMLRPATPAECSALWPAARAAHLFRDAPAFEAFHAAAPWRVQVASGGRAAVVERWRDHLDMLAIRALWAGDRDVGALLGELAALARSHGYGRLMSPLVPRDIAAPYERGGMSVHQSIVALRIDARHAAHVAAAPVPGVRLRSASPDDLEGLCRVDGECFDLFWAYEPRRIAAAMVAERLALAEDLTSGTPRLIGYTTCTVERGSGTLGRLAVDPRDRGRGVGALLLADALVSMAARGAATISLCTQEDNAPSRALYSRGGLRELPGRLLFLAGDV